MGCPGILRQPLRALSNLGDRDTVVLQCRCVGHYSNDVHLLKFCRRVVLSSAWREPHGSPGISKAIKWNQSKLVFFDPSVFFFKFYFIFKLYITVLVLPNIKMNPPQVYMCSPP